MITLEKQFTVTPEQVCCEMGYAADSAPAPRVAALIKEHLDGAQPLIKPSYSYLLRRIELVFGASVLLEDGAVFHSRTIARLLERADEVAVFALTIGGELEDEAARLAREGFVLQATVLETIGSLYTQQLTDWVETRIEDLAHVRGQTISRRFSPGYCDWDVSQQKTVFHLLRDDCAGISLTDSCLMIPRKSMSGIIGIGDSGITDYNPCRTCEKHDCVGRR
ncbi:MAG: hypothetical protein JW790_04535 [Dehalococcoidales bacterium]|nr:hypothetical protein [Dehalococcoidales bacterium]